MYTVNEMINKIDVNNEATFTEARETAARFLREKNGESQHTVHAMGHCHIDSGERVQVIQHTHSSFRLSIYI